jgi:plasmid stability protein
MSSLLLRDVPEHIHHRLKVRAHRNRRSLRAELLELLDTALADVAGPPTMEELDRLRIRGNRPLTDDLLQTARHEDRP